MGANALGLRVEGPETHHQVRPRVHDQRLGAGRRRYVLPGTDLDGKVHHQGAIPHRLIEHAVQPDLVLHRRHLRRR
jgi:hypothetical protein